MLLQKIQNFVFYSLLIIPTFIFTKHLGGVGLENPANITTWYLMILFACITSIKVITDKEIYWSKNSSTAFLFFLLILVTYILNHGLSVIGYEVLLAVFFSFIFLVSMNQYKIDTKKILSILIIIAVIHAFLAYCQLFKISSITSFLNIPYSTRIYSTITQVNILATVVMIGMTALILKFLENKNKIVIFISGFILLATINFATYSRSGILSFFILVLFVIYCVRKDKKLISLFLFSSLMSFWLSKSILLVGSDNSSLDKVILGDPVRFDLYTSSLKIFIQNWEHGFGYEDFKKNFFFGLRDVGIDNKSLINQYFAHPHNEFLYWMMMGGIINLIGIIALLIKFYRDNIKKINKTFMIYVPIVINLMFEQAFVNSVYLLFLFLLSTSMTDKYKFNNKPFPIAFNKINKLILSTTMVSIMVSITMIGAHGMYSTSNVVKLVEQKKMAEVLGNIEKIGTPMIGADNFNWALNNLIYGLAIRSKDSFLIDKSIEFYEKECDYLPNKIFYRKLATLYLANEDLRKFEEVRVKARYYFNVDIKVSNSEE